MREPGKPLRYYSPAELMGWALLGAVIALALFVAGLKLSGAQLPPQEYVVAMGIVAGPLLMWWLWSWCQGSQGKFPKDRVH